MQFLVTGGAGFIGSHLVHRLIADGHAVTVLDNLSSGKRENLPPKAQFILGDAADSATITPLIARAETIIHLAAVASVEACEREVEAAHRTNFTGSALILDQAAIHRIPVIYASSAAVYGNSPALPLSEAIVTTPINRYGHDKLATETHARKLALPSIGLRFFNVYGPRQDADSPYSGVITKFLSMARAGQPITFFGDGEQTRDFIYVSDIVALILRAIAHTPNITSAHVYNGCTNHTTSLKQLATSISLTLDVILTTHHAAAKPGDIRHSLGDPSLAARELGFRAKTSLADGLARLVAYA